MKIGKMVGLMAIVVMMLLPMLPVKADEVHININMDGDAYVTVENNNGTFAVWYNGRDILEEIEDQYDTISDLQAVIAALAAREDIDDVKEELDEVNQQFGVLVNDLDNVFDDLYHTMGFLLHVTGVNPGNTTVGAMLQSGNVTMIASGCLSRSAPIRASLRRSIPTRERGMSNRCCRSRASGLGG